MSVWKDRVIVDSYLNKTVIPNAADQIHALLHILRNNEQPLLRFVDLGAGDGIISQIILDQFDDSTAVLVDFSKPMLEAAEKRLWEYKDRAVIVEADLSSPDWQRQVFTSEKDTIDAFISRYSIHHLHHGRKFELYEELFRRLNPGGLFVNIEHVASKSGWGETLNNEIFIERITEQAKGRIPEKTTEQIRQSFFDREDQFENKLLAAETQCDWLRWIGFTDVDIFFKCFELAVFAGRRSKW